VPPSGLQCQQAPACDRRGRCSSPEVNTQSLALRGNSFGGWARFWTSIDQGRLLSSDLRSVTTGRPPPQPFILADDR
jgi:hypothetical protein